MNDFQGVEEYFNPGQPTIGSTQDQEAFANATSFVLDKYDMGITLLKKDANGIFQEQHFVKTTDANGNAVFSKFNCN